MIGGLTLRHLVDGQPWDPVEVTYVAGYDPIAAADGGGAEQRSRRLRMQPFEACVNLLYS